MLSTELRRTLVAAGKAMALAHDEWWIIAGAAVALHGVEAIAVHDVDILLTIADAEHILPPLGLSPEPGAADDRFRSAVFATWNAPPLATEFMAAFEHHDGNEWQPVRPQTRQSVTIDGVDVFVPDRREVAAMLHRFGRPKDLARAALLAALEPPPDATASQGAVISATA